MGKIFIFLILIIAGGMFYLKDNFKVGGKGFTEKAPEAAKQLTRKETMNQEGRLNKFTSGECITKHKDGWEFTKIYSANDSEYTFIDCHQYKGCVRDKSTMARIQFELSVGKVRVIPCPQVQGRDL